MSRSVHQELRELTRALRAHVEMLADANFSFVLEPDEAWIEQRRDEYRQLVVGTDELELLTWGSEAEPAPHAPAPIASRPPSPAPPAPPSPTPPAPAPHAPAPIASRPPSPGTRGTASPAVSAPVREATPKEASTAAVNAPARSGSTDSATHVSRALEALARGHTGPADDSAFAGEAQEAAPANPSPAGPPLATLEHLSLVQLEETVQQCRLCPLGDTRTQAVFSRGNGSSGLLFIGEGPGAEEDAQGQPFVGPAGQLLDRMVIAMGLQRDDVYVCNIVKCRPPKNRKPTPDEVKACSGYLERQIDLLKPRVIVALGATAMHSLLGLEGGITGLRGEWRLYRGRIPVMPTFHPAYLLRQPAAKRDVWNDLQVVMKELNPATPSPAAELE